MFIIAAITLAVLFGLLVIAISLSWRRVVPTNMVHIVQSSKKTISFGSSQTAGNTYYEFPSWLPVIGVTVSKFPESVFSISLKDYEAYDIGRLPFKVDVRAFFRISDSQIASRRVANYTQLEDQLLGVLQGAVRRILATNTLEHTMQDRSSLGQQFTEEVDHGLTEWGVSTVKMIEFMDIRDHDGSQVIANMMAKEKSRIEKESRVAVAANIQEAQTKEIEAQRQVALSKTEAEQQVGIRDAEKAKTIGIAQEKSNQEIQSEAKTTAERQMEVQKVNEVKAAEIARDVAVVRAQQDQQVKVVAAQADRDAATHIADGKLAATIKESEGVKALGEARADAESKMLLAPVNAQLTLAKEIGDNDGYQNYLIKVKNIEASQAVGIEMASAIRAADLKIIANSGDMQSGIGNLADIFTPKGGTSIGGMLTALSQTAEGSALVDGVVAKLSAGNGAPAASGAGKSFGRGKTKDTTTDPAN